MNTNVHEDVIPARSAIVTHLSWSSIIAGVIITSIVFFTLALLGVAIGFGSIEPRTQQNPLAGLGVGSIIGWAIISIISLFIGGWISSRMAGIQRSFDGAIHGLVTWGLSTMLMLFILTSTVGAIIGGSLGLVKNVAMVAGGATGAAASAAPGATQGVVNQLQQAIPQGTQNITPQQRQQMEMQAREVGGKVAKGAAAGALGTFILMVLEGLAAAFGGIVGRNKGPVSV